MVYPWRKSHVHLRRMYILLLLDILYMFVRSNWFILLFKSSLSLLIFCLNVLSLITAEVSILVFDWMTKPINFTLLGYELCCIPLNSVRLCSWAQFHYLGSPGAFWGLFPMHCVQYYKVFTRSGYQRHKIFPAFCELWKLFSYCFPVVLSLVLSRSYHHLQIKTQPKTEGEPSAGLQSAYTLECTLLL